VEVPFTSWPVAGYLSDDRYGLRAPNLDDAERSVAWYEGPYLLSPESARSLLAEQETIPWGANPTIRLMVVDLAAGVVAGGALVERTDNRISELRITAGGPDFSNEERQKMRAAVLGLLAPWVMGELDLMTARIDVPADETILIDAAGKLGMVEAARLREHVARPTERVDLLMLELVNRDWGSNPEGYADG
jgi:RimJ/RimL family protein N-acetyltransferase